MQKKTLFTGQGKRFPCPVKCEGFLLGYRRIDENTLGG